MKKYAEELSSSLNRATAAAVGGVAILTWFFSAMQCNKEHCYTTDNPVMQVTLSFTLAAATVMGATSKPVLNAVTSYAGPVIEKVNQAKAYLEGRLASHKSAAIEAVDTGSAEAAKSGAEGPVAEQKQKSALPLTESGLFSPKSDSVRANASETSASSPRTPSPSPTNQ